MKKQLILALGFVSLSACGLMLTGCATDAGPILAPPPPGVAHDQKTGVHPAHSPLFNKDLKNPTPYLKKDHLHK